MNSRWVAITAAAALLAAGTATAQSLGGSSSGGGSGIGGGGGGGSGMGSGSGSGLSLGGSSDSSGLSGGLSGFDGGLREDTPVRRGAGMGTEGPLTRDDEFAGPLTRDTFGGPLTRDGGLAENAGTVPEVGGDLAGRTEVDPRLGGRVPADGSQRGSQAQGNVEVPASVEERDMPTGIPGYVGTRDSTPNERLR